VNYLRLPGTETDSGMVSLWHTHYCSAGEGTVAYVHIPGAFGFEALCTDNNALADFMVSWMKGRGGIYDRELSVCVATFRRAGDIRQTPSWYIETEQNTVIATWERLEKLVLLDGPAPKFSADRDVYSLLFFAESARISVNGRAVPGAPYLRDIWKSSIGGERSSCVVALSETFIDIPPEQVK
jgi:hypothetical protein